MKKNWLLFLIIVFLALPNYAEAVPWVWEDIFDPDDIYFSGTNKGGLQSFGFTHDLKDDGFDPFEDLITSYGLSLSFYDDDDTRIEKVFIDQPGLFGDGVFIINFNDIELGWSIAGLVTLNLTGQMNVTINRVKGDFYFDDSVLTAKGCEQNPVPEPSTLILLGFGVLGLVGIKRKKSNK